MPKGSFYNLIFVNINSNFVGKHVRKKFPVFIHYARLSNNVQAHQIRLKKRDLGPGAFLLLSIPVASFGLGIWQIQRKKWKEGLIQDLMMKTKMPVVALPFEERDIKDLEYRQVSVSGRFDHSQEMYLGPRSCLVDGESKRNKGNLISSSKDVSGYLVITPFILSDTNERILVNRGWIPFKKKKPETRKQGQVEEEVELTGIVRLSEPRSQFFPHNKPDVRVWFFRDVELMAEVTNCRPVFLDATAETTVQGGPIGGQTRAHLRNEHFSYIITWFSLSAATSALWYFRYIK